MISACLPLICTGLADSAGNVSISVSAPVTSVNGMTGAVTISSVSTATSATTTPNVAVCWFKGTNNFGCAGGSYSGSYWTLPSGGTWRYLRNSGTIANMAGGAVSGGSKIQMVLDSGTHINGAIAIRVS